MKAIIVSILLVLPFSFGSFAIPANRPYPLSPDPRVTPGSLCKGSSVRRYPEGIYYCNRNVDSDLKEEVIRTYDRQFGYRIQAMSRGQFKIDHFIPLCAGGGNDRANLWPQYVTVYNITDPLEPAICNKMAQGRLQQAEAIKLVIAAKTDLTKVPKVLEYLNRL